MQCDVMCCVVQMIMALADDQDELIDRDRIYECIYYIDYIMRYYRTCMHKYTHPLTRSFSHLLSTTKTIQRWWPQSYLEPHTLDVQTDILVQMDRILSNTTGKPYFSHVYFYNSGHVYKTLLHTKHIPESSN